MKSQSREVSTAAVVVDLKRLSDTALVEEVGRRAGRERAATADLLRALIEFDRRRLYKAEGYASLFAYCTEALHYSEHAAFNRIEVARAAARWPQMLDAIEDGSLHLAGARLLAPHLTHENVEGAIASARHKSKREIEDVAAALAHRNVLVAVAAEQYRLHLTISRHARDLLRQAQALLSHQLPHANEAVIIEQALALLVRELERKRTAATTRPRKAAPARTRTRHIPAAVKREVWRRDEGRCAFVGRQGRCREQHFLEFHHVQPYAAGGTSTVQNIELRCRAHNAYEAERYFGPEAVAAARDRGRRERAPAASLPLSEARDHVTDAPVTEESLTAEGSAAAAELAPGRVPE